MSECRHDDETTRCATCGRSASLGEVDRIETLKANVANDRDRLRAELAAAHAPPDPPGIGAALRRQQADECYAGRELK
ncbi:MAG: hypothetical protein A2Y78_08955 [Acidobacteria bacterium RBG_13_68_16]|nr:MAG: hypothetical protein A2Y78_08955 [Acidobacteria bacterium RBG_13_68_16]